MTAALVIDRPTLRVRYGASRGYQVRGNVVALAVPAGWVISMANPWTLQLRRRCQGSPSSSTDFPAREARLILSSKHESRAAGMPAGPRRAQALELVGVKTAWRNGVGQPSEVDRNARGQLLQWLRDQQKCGVIDARQA